ncbi:MFS transporter [Nocardia arthritidis]|uniref:MFS transporter n=1 Tax=Nocardia arthritidis TaxID=228602 RepID=A0A6G9Y6B0_9NOCA|nr:MFS transporter [Nocardia arthritidis]QIS08729.1 MFS transporter [Nocardia arthritidis]
MSASFGGKARTTLLTLCAPLLFEGMSLSSINVQLAAIRRDLGLPDSQLQMVAGAFLATYAGFLLLGGRLGDRWGRRRVFLIGVTIFGSASLGAALAWDGWSLIAARACQGVGAAVTAPAAVALIVAAFPLGAARGWALGVLSAMGAVGFSLGVVAGGVLTELLGWRGTFVCYLPLALVTVLVGAFVLRGPGEPSRAATTVAWIPALLITTGLILAVYGLGRIGAASAAGVLGPLGVGALLFVTFAFTQVRDREPLLPRTLLGNPRLTAAGCALAGTFAGITGAMFVTGIHLQDGHGYSPAAAGFAFLPQGIAVACCSPVAGRLAHRYSAQRLLLGGLLTVSAGLFLYIGVERGGYLTHMAPAAILVGAGIAACYPAAVMLASAAAAEGEQATASGILTTYQQAGSALGIAVATAIQAIGPSRNWFGPAALWGCFAFSIAALIGCAVLLAASATRRSRVVVPL